MSDKRPRITSAVIVINEENKVLLAERNKKNYNGFWIIPGGGVEFGETLKDAAIREIKEETNLDVEIIKLVGHKEIINIPGDYHSVVFFYIAKPKNKEIEAREDISSANFFGIEEIKKLKIAKGVEWALKEIGFWK